MFSQNLLETLKAARHITILTGAGVSAENGVPTFRGQEGLWEKYRLKNWLLLKPLGGNSKLVWEWYNYRRSTIKEKSPNSGSLCISENATPF